MLYVAFDGARRDAAGSHHHTIAFDQVLRNGGARPGPTHFLDATDGNIKAGGNFAGVSAACTGQRQEEKNELPNGFHTANFIFMELYRTWTQEKASGPHSGRDLSTSFGQHAGGRSQKRRFRNQLGLLLD